MHVFGREQLVEFGRSGGGPFELEDPVDLAWQDSTLILLDMNQRKLVAFVADGSPSYSRSLGNDWARRLYVARSDTILGTFVPMSDERAIIRLRGSARDTIYRLPAGRKVLQVGQRGLYATWADDLGGEFVELYRRPAWADS